VASGKAMCRFVLHLRWFNQYIF